MRLVGSMLFSGLLLATTLSALFSPAAFATTPAELTRDLLQSKAEIPAGTNWTVQLQGPDANLMLMSQHVLSLGLHPCYSENSSFKKKSATYARDKSELAALIAGALRSDKAATVRYREEFDKLRDVRNKPEKAARTIQVDMSIWEFDTEEKANRFDELMQRIADEAMPHASQLAANTAMLIDGNIAQRMKRAAEPGQLQARIRNATSAIPYVYHENYRKTVLNLGDGGALLDRWHTLIHEQATASDWKVVSVAKVGESEGNHAMFAYARKGRRMLMAWCACSEFETYNRCVADEWVDGRHVQQDYVFISSPPFPKAVVMGIIRAAYYKMAHETPTTDTDMDDDAGIPLEVKVYARGYQGASEYFRTDVDPSEIILSGTVRDQYGKPVAEALVVLVEKNVEVHTDTNGAYRLVASHDGSTPYSTTLDFMLLKQRTGLTARWVESPKITANGKSSKVVLELTDADGPLREQRVDLSDTMGFRREGKPIDYVSTGQSNSRRWTTDGNGRLAFTLHHPGSPMELPAGLRAETAFPVVGALKIRDLKSKTETVAPYPVESPFPRIVELATGRPIEAGQWQIQPSTITIEDADSDVFEITLKGPGAFKAEGDTASKGTGHPRSLYQEVRGNRFRFHYKPKYQGLDLEASQPEILKELAELAGNVYLSVLTNVASEKMLDAAALHYPGQSFSRAFLINDKGVVSTVYITGKLKRASDGATNTLEVVSAASNLANVGFKGYASQDEVLKTLSGQGSTEDVITTGDNVIGLVDTALGYTSLNTKGALYWEALKASWEADKVAYKISKQFYDLAEAYQDMLPEEVTITVVDETGRKARALGQFKVLVWKGGSQ